MDEHTQSLSLSLSLSPAIAFWHICHRFEMLAAIRGRPSSRPPPPPPSRCIRDFFHCARRPCTVGGRCCARSSRATLRPSPASALPRFLDNRTNRLDSALLFLFFFSFYTAPAVLLPRYKHRTIITIRSRWRRGFFFVQSTNAADVYVSPNE